MVSLEEFIIYAYFFGDYYRPPVPREVFEQYLFWIEDNCNVVKDGEVVTDEKLERKVRSFRKRVGRSINANGVYLLVQKALEVKKALS